MASFSQDTIADIASDFQLSEGKDLYKKYEMETKIATQHIRSDIINSKFTLGPNLMFYAAISVDGGKTISNRPVMTKGGKLSAPKTGGMCTISGPYQTPSTQETISVLLKELFSKLKKGMYEVAKTDTKARLTLSLVKKKVANTRKIIPSFDPFMVLNPHIYTLANYLEEVVYKSSDLFPKKFIPLLVVYFDVNAKPPRCNYEILVVNNPAPDFVKFEL